MAKADYIRAYYDDLQKRIAFLSELYDMRRKDEALMLCCCYIEALGSRQSPEPERKAKNYCNVLGEQGKNEIWRLVHPKQLKNVLADNGLFKGTLDALEPLINDFGAQLVQPEQVRANLDPALNEQQRLWLDNNLFKATIASISYERIRSELVHDISAASISFSETSYKGQPVPDLNFEMLYTSLRHIVNTSQERAVATNKWWFEE
jgi:hypothetical protein